jgi:hypothetical protein
MIDLNARESVISGFRSRRPALGVSRSVILRPINEMLAGYDYRLSRWTP